MSQKKVPSFQSIKSLPADFRNAGSRLPGGMGMSSDSAISESDELSGGVAERSTNGRGNVVGSNNDESPYSSLDMSAQDGVMLADESDNDPKDVRAPTRSKEQVRVDSMWSDTTPYASKKVCMDCILKFCYGRVSRSIFCSLVSSCVSLLFVFLHVAKSWRSLGARLC